MQISGYFAMYYTDTTKPYCATMDETIPQFDMKSFEYWIPETKHCDLCTPSFDIAEIIEEELQDYFEPTLNDTQHHYAVFTQTESAAKHLAKHYETTLRAVANMVHNYGLVDLEDIAEFTDAEPFYIQTLSRDFGEFISPKYQNRFIFLTDNAHNIDGVTTLKCGLIAPTPYSFAVNTSYMLG